MLVFQSNIVATYAVKEKVIKPLGLRIERHLDKVDFHVHVISPYKVMKPMETNCAQYLLLIM